MSDMTGTNSASGFTATALEKVTEEQSEFRRYYINLQREEQNELHYYLWFSTGMNKKHLTAIKLS